MKGVVFILMMLAFAGFSQGKEITLDAKLTSVELFKKIPVATVVLFEGGKKIDSTVTQNGRCFFKLEENKDYKIEFSKTGYVSKHLLLETTGIPDDAKKKMTVKVEMTLFTFKPGLNVDFLNDKPIGVAKYEEVYKKIKWDEDYTRAIEEMIIHATLEYHKKKQQGLLKIEPDTLKSDSTSRN